MRCFVVSSIVSRVAASSLADRLGRMRCWKSGEFDWYVVQEWYLSVTYSKGYSTSRELSNSTIRRNPEAPK